ncbi:MAG: hypothetical protein ACK4MF_11120 [Hyphomicrobiaceae bacterium]
MQKMADAELVGSKTNAPKEGTPLVAEQIEYMADMILEMQELAAHAGLSTLAGILKLAHSEALLQIGRQSMLEADAPSPANR